LNPAGAIMLNRLSISFLLTSIISLMAVVIVAIMAFGAWESWTRVRSTSRLAIVADASVHMFTALANLRLDRTASTRDLQADQTFAAVNQQIIETAAMKCRRYARRWRRWSRSISPIARGY
jgi:hypothetical protein